jgi:Ca-activated chloride channel family protein
MPDSTLTRSAGLFSTDRTHQMVPLAGVSIEADLRSLYARVIVAHRYVNQEDAPIEAVYVFPLDEGAAVCGFEAVVAGTRVVGEVHERDAAFEMYDDAMEAGHGAFLLDEERPDVFQASIGNLPPGAEAVVKLTYVTELPVDDGRLRFTLPTTVSPRYAPAQDRVGPGRSDAEALNPPVALEVPYGLSLSIRAVMPHGITAVESPSHPIALRMQDGCAMVSLAQKEAPLDGDFVLSIEAPGLDAPQALVERDEEGNEAIGVAFAPAFAIDATPAELIFLVDRSGSMRGDPIAEVRNALQLCLRSMTSGCRFNIVGYGSTHQALFRKSQAYDQRALQTASAHVADIEADLGGTELLPALEFVLERAVSAELPRHVVVLTDGQVTNTDAVFELAARYAHNTRIFTFGIGPGASHHLVRGLARAGGGTAEFIYPGERIEPKVLRQLGRLLSPALTDVEVEWLGGTVTQAPLKIPPVFAGGRLMLYGLVKDRRPSRVRLTAKAPAGPLAFDVPVPEPADGSRRTVATLAARARIRELEEGSEWLSGRGSRQKDRKTAGARNEIVALSRRYTLLSRETSFVAIERRDTPVAGDVQLRKVPIALTSGWGAERQLGLRQALSSVGGLKFGSAMRDYGASAPRRVGASLQRSASWFRRGRPVDVPPVDVPDFLLEDDADDDENDNALIDPLAAPRGPSRLQAGVATRSSGVNALILLQSSDGSWDLTDQLASILGREPAELRSAIQGAPRFPQAVRRAWATALALVWLDRNAADRQEEWRLLANKARAWIAGTAVPAPGGGTWIAKAETFLGR